MSNQTRDGFALIISDKTGKPIVKHAFQIYDDAIVDDIVDALRSVDNVECIPTTFKRDVFGRLFHVPTREEE